MMDAKRNVPAWHATNSLYAHFPVQYPFEFMVHELDSVDLGYYLGITEWHPYTHYYMSVKPNELKKVITMAERKPTKIAEFDKKRNVWKTDERPEGSGLDAFQATPEREVVNAFEPAPKPIEPPASPDAAKEELKRKLRFMNDFFKNNFDYLFQNKTIQDFMVNHEEFDEVEKLCQA